ncbi:PREDICTED: uncharacterized protein LOC109215473 [Nicotiana attenuata]|uniref:uncharacterized protein LOC109215473 n=1 Tax=Nicotiana attenuata TaxID=49451 RepID=UPI000905B773|nr:PREDICTED: uncharacterized protein LOC109215473 [Nicotiana attenuata]
MWPPLHEVNSARSTPIDKGEQIQSVKLLEKIPIAENIEVEKVIQRKEVLTMAAEAQISNKPAEEQKKEWVNLFAGNNLASRGMSLKFIAPIVKNGEKIIELDTNEIDRETMKWQHAIVLYVMGESPSIGMLDQFIATQWNFISKPKIYFHNDGYFVVKLNSMEDKDAVLASGPYMIRNKPIIVKAWSPNFDFSKEVLQTIPIWLKLPNLPLNCWSMDSLSRIGSGLGIPLYADECTSKIERISYARLLVEMDVTKDMPTMLKVMDPKGNVFEQAIDYDWIPEYCHTCLQVVHSCRNVQKAIEGKQKQQKPKMEWRRRIEPSRVGKDESVPTKNVIQASKIRDTENEKLPDWELTKRKSVAKSGIASIRGDTCEAP